jgi:hypothetical protein
MAGLFSPSVLLVLLLFLLPPLLLPSSRRYDRDLPEVMLGPLGITSVPPTADPPPTGEAAGAALAAGEGMSKL